jgi:hypothetical protein
MQYYIFNLTSYIDDVIEVRQGGFRCDRSTTYQISCMRQILEKKCEKLRSVGLHQLFIDFKKD